MIIALLGVTFVLSLGVSSLAVLFFLRPVRRIMGRIVADEVSAAWVRYLVFAIYVVGLAGGVGVRRIERYIAPAEPDAQLLTLTGERWVIELYSTVIGTLGAIAWALLIFFVFALVAYVVVRAMEVRRGRGGEEASPSAGG